MPNSPHPIMWVSVTGHTDGLISTSSSSAPRTLMRSISSPLARRLHGDIFPILSWEEPVGDCSGGKSCRYSVTLSGESAKVPIFSSSDEGGWRSSGSSVIGRGGVARADSAMVVAVTLPVDEGGGEGSRATALEGPD